jgi:hypothetical protein
MTAIERLQSTMQSLGLTAIEARVEALLERASKTEPSYGDFLLEVLGAEADARRQRYLKTRLHEASAAAAANVFITLRRRTIRPSPTRTV